MEAPEQFGTIGSSCIQTRVHDCLWLLKHTPVDLKSVPSPCLLKLAQVNISHFTKKKKNLSFTCSGNTGSTGPKGNKFKPNEEREVLK
jgi:hypothetical protein